MTESNQPKRVLIAIGTQNRAKIEGVEAAFKTVFASIDAKGFSVESGIPEQPTSDEEAVRGAINRADAAMNQVQSADYAVGLEGTVCTVHGTMFLHGWVAIRDKHGTLGLGHSSGVELPKWMEVAINGGAELGSLVRELMDDSDNEVRHSLGAVGVLTGGRETRVKEFSDATVMALAKFIKPQYYQT